MSIPNRQIGWSQESNLLSYISKQLDKLNSVVAATAAGGLLNPSTDYIPYNSGLAFGDSFLVNDATNSVLKTVYSATDVGLKLDFTNQNYILGDPINKIGFTADLVNSKYYIGDVDNNGNYLLIDGGSGLYKTLSGGNDIGLELDFANGQYIFGDANENYLFLNSPNGNFQLANQNGFGLSGEYKTSILKRLIYIGDYDGNNNVTNIIIDDVNQKIETEFSAGKLGLRLDFANGEYKLGDLVGASSDSYLSVDAGNTVIELGTDLITTSAAGASAGKFLKLRVGGVDYKLALLNNV